MLNSVFSGLVLVLGALTTFAAARSRRIGVQRREHRRLERRFLVALAHIFRLEQDLADRGVTPPKRPSELDDDDDPDVAGLDVPATTVAPPPTPPPGGAHARP